MFGATSQGNVEEVKKILKNHPNLDVNKTDETKQNVLFKACGSGQYAIVSILLAHPGINVNQRNHVGRTLFMQSCEKGHLSCVHLLLGDSRVRVNEPGKNGHTPLWFAAVNGRLDVIKWWIASGREMYLGTPGHRKSDAIGRSEKSGNPEVVALLERFKNDAAKTRDEIRMELGINGKYSCSCSILLSDYF